MYFFTVVRGQQFNAAALRNHRSVGANLSSCFHIGWRPDRGSFSPLSGWCPHVVADILTATYGHQEARII
jgi:hypothetical protein